MTIDIARLRADISGNSEHVFYGVRLLALLDRLEAAERVVKAYRNFDEVRHLPAGRNDEEYILAWEAADSAIAAYDRVAAS